MADDDTHIVQEDLESLKDMRLKEEEHTSDEDMDTIAVTKTVKMERSTNGAHSGDSTPSGIKRQSRSPTKTSSMAYSPAVKGELEDTIGGGITLKLEPGKLPKLARTTSQKVAKQPPQLFLEYEDRTDEATSTFTVLPECTYANKYLGSTEHALECDCAEEWGKLPHQSGHTLDLNGRVSDAVYRLYDTYEPCLWRGFRLHQPRHQDGVRGGLRVRSCLPKPPISA